MNTFFFVELLQQGGVWGYLILFTSLLMLFISLVLTHIPLRWLGKIPTIVHGVFLLPFLILILGVSVGFSYLEEVLKSLQELSFEQQLGLEAKGTRAILSAYLMLGLYSLMPFWFAFRSMMAFILIQKEKKWRAGIIGCLPSMSAWFLACVVMIVLLAVSDTDGYGIEASAALLVMFTTIVPFASMTLADEDGDKLAFVSNYLSVLSAWVLFLCAWTYEWTLRLRSVETAMLDNELIEISQPFSEEGQTFVGLICLVLLGILFYYAAMMKSQKIQAIILILITMMVFAGTYLLGARAEVILDSYQAYQVSMPAEAQKEFYKGIEVVEAEDIEAFERSLKDKSGFPNPSPRRVSDSDLGPKSNANIQKIEMAAGVCSDEITKTVRKYLAQVTSCHDSALKSDPEVKGRIVVDIEIVGGRVLIAKISSNKTGNQELGSCIEKRIKRWNFPSDCTDVVSIPFALSPKP